MAGAHTIKTPRGTISVGAGGMAELTWNPGFGSQYTGIFNRKQAFVDSEVLRYCSPLVPFQTGTLEHSGTLGTDVGSGVVEYIAPYSHHQYYETADSRAYDPNRGAHWFERMKAAHKKDIEAGLQKI